MDGQTVDGYSNSIIFKRFPFLTGNWVCLQAVMQLFPLVSRNNVLIKTTAVASRCLHETNVNGFPIKRVWPHCGD
jgi:hypothetical protein